MPSNIRPRLTYANIVATLALFVALGGGAYAAVTLPADSVGTKQLKNRAVTPAKVARETITLFKGQKGDKGDTGPQGPQGAPGANGINGTNGQQGPIGPSDAYSVSSGNPTSLTLPAGKYVIWALADAFTNDGPGGPFAAGCSLTAESDSDGSSVMLPATSGLSEETIANQLTHTFPATGTVTYSCGEMTGNVGFHHDRIIAIAVGALHPQ